MDLLATSAKQRDQQIERALNSWLIKPLIEIVQDFTVQGYIVVSGGDTAPNGWEALEMEDQLFEGIMTHGDVFALDVATNLWQVLPSLPDARRAHSMVAVGTNDVHPSSDQTHGKMNRTLWVDVLGGMDSGGDYSFTNFRCPVGQTEWQSFRLLSLCVFPMGHATVTLQTTHQTAQKLRYLSVGNVNDDALDRNVTVCNPITLMCGPFHCPKGKRTVNQVAWENAYPEIQLNETHKWYTPMMVTAGPRLYLMECNPSLKRQALRFPLTCLDMTTGQWMDDVTPCSRSHFFGCMTALDSNVYVCGGYSSPIIAQYTSPKECDVYDSVTNIWRALPDLPRARLESRATTVDGAIYVCGGHTSRGTRPTRTVFRYSPTTNAWTSVAPLPAARGDSAVCTVYL